MYSLIQSKIGAGVKLCIEKALAQSGVSKEDVNYINAHATSTPAGDIKEYQALIHCFGQNPEVYVPFHVIVTFVIFLIVFIIATAYILLYLPRCFFFIQLKVNSTKSMIGHLLGASGGVEAVATVQVKINESIVYEM